MKILMVSPFAPYPPNSGGRIRQWEQIKYLGSRHDLTVVSFISPEEEDRLTGVFDGYCSKAIMVRNPDGFLPSEHPGLNRLPWPVRTFGAIEMRRTLQQLVSIRFDIVILEFIYMAQHCDLFSACTILHEHNIESSIFKQYAALPHVSEEKIFGMKKPHSFWNATWMLMESYENRMWPKFPLRVTVSENDKKEMDSRCSYGQAVVIENGVDTQAITPVEKSSKRKILFMGTMDYYPNIDAASSLAKSIMPFIWQKDPSIRLCIAGRNPSQPVRAFASDPRIEVVVNPENMREVAEDCCLTVVPLRLGGGTRIKILDSMAMGLPVVSTSVGCEGLVVTDGRDILIRDDPKSFADAVLKVLSDGILANTLRVNGRRLVEERYDWGVIFRQLEQELLPLVEKTGHHVLRGNGK